MRTRSSLCLGLALVLAVPAALGALGAGPVPAPGTTASSAQPWSLEAWPHVTPSLARLAQGPAASWESYLGPAEERLLGAPQAPAALPAARLPSAALRELLAAEGVPGAVEPATLAALDALPRAPRDALGQLLDAHLAGATLVRAAFPGAAVLTPAQLAAMAGPDTTLPPPVDLAPMLQAQRLALAAAQQVVPVLQAHAEALRAVPVVQVCGVVLLELTGDNSLHGCMYRLAVDMGGDDAWQNNAGGNGESVPLSGNFGAGGAALAIDLAGNDRYEGQVGQGSVAGGGFGGIGLLVEVAGNDVYRAGVQKAGATTGGAEAGVGTLLELDGDDDYYGATGLAPEFHNEGGGVNGGSVAGVGVHVDFAGNDRYDGMLLGAGGINGGSHGGTGCLIDYAGDDTYRGSVANLGGVNGAAFGGAGSLLDVAGDDDYDGFSGTFGGVNGGAFVGTGTLLDLAGNDVYDGTNLLDGGVNGGGFELQGSGFLFDGAGNDRFTAYLGGAGGVNGGSFFGAGGLINNGGDDVYDTRLGPSQVRAINGGTFFGVGFLIDTGGTDLYRDIPGGAFAQDQTIIPKGSVGLQWDIPL